MQNIDISELKSGESKTVFKKISETEVMEIVVQVRIQKVENLEITASEIEKSTVSKEARINSDKNHVTKLRALKNLEIGETNTILLVKNQIK